LNAAEIKHMLANQAAEVARMLLPQGKQRGSEWKAGNTSGEPGDSLSVCIRGHKAGVWRTSPATSAAT
jgi:twinkle protein